MEERKINKYSFTKGILPKTISKEAHARGLSKAGQGRVTKAVKAAAEYEGRKLRYGVGASHIDELRAFSSSKKYKRAVEQQDRLKGKKEIDAVNKTLDVFFKQKPVAEKPVLKVEPKTVAKLPPRFVPSVPKAQPIRQEPKATVIPLRPSLPEPPRPSNDNEEQQAA